MGMQLRRSTFLRYGVAISGVLVYILNYVLPLWLTQIVNLMWVMSFLILVVLFCVALVRGYIHLRREKYGRRS